MEKLPCILEADLHRQVATYLKLQYPSVIFRTDFAAGIRLNKVQASRHKALQSGRAYPDIFIAEPRNVYNGLFLELKRHRKEVYTADGKLRNLQHIREQADTLAALADKGYCALFACGWNEAKKLIDGYLTNWQNFHGD
jgi:hypothetical protein